MAVPLRRPVLVVGVGLTCALGLLDVLHPSVLELSGLITLGMIAGIMGRRWTQKSGSVHKPTETIERVAVETLLANVQTLLGQLQSEVETARLTDQLQFSLPDLQAQVIQLMADLDREVLHLAVVGAQGVGKTTLLQILPSQVRSNLTWQDTSGLFAVSPQIPEASLPSADLILFVTAGDLTDPEFQTLNQLVSQGQRTLLVLNKQDQYLPAERSLVWQHLRERVQGVLQAEDVVAIAAQPAPLKVRQHQVDGSQVERWECLSAETQDLNERLHQVLRQEQESLVWARTWRSALALQGKVQADLNAVRRLRSLPIVEQFQWMAAATAFATPLPVLDLMATTAINAQMVLDLGTIYQQRFSLQQAQTVASTLGGLLVKLGLVELSTQMIGTVLKSNLFTFVAGGFVQGASAAYLTRLAGLSLIEAFQEQALVTSTEEGMNLDALGKSVRDRLSRKLQMVFQQTQQSSFWQGFVQQALERLVPATSMPQLAAATATPLSCATPAANLEENKTINVAFKSLEPTPLP